MAAPSAGNEQPWHFVVLRDRAALDSIPKFHRYASMVPEANLCFLVCSKTTGMKYEGFWPQDCSAAIENILLGAHERGLGACWLGIYPIPEYVDSMRKLCNVPPDVAPFAIIVVGHPAEEKPPANRYDETRVHLEKW
jgi:nitroreductase